MKRIFIAILSTVVVASGMIFYGYQSGNQSASALVDRADANYISCSANDQMPDMGITARSAYLLDYGSGKVLYALREKERYPIASMCKIMTLILIYEDIESGKFSVSDSITVSESAAGMGGSQIFLDANGSYKIDDLIKGIVVSSANDASVAMAELIAGSEEGFVARMNQKAKQLGMANTNFANCTGLPKPGQYSTAEDVGIMTRELLSHKEYYKHSRIWMDKLEHKGGRETELTNTNKLVRFYKGCDGGKTGYTSEAKHCVSATAVRDGMRLISVIIGADNSKTRFAEASKMLNHGYANYVSKKVVDHTQPLEAQLTVRGGTQKQLKVMPGESCYVLTRRNDSADIKLDYALPDRVKAPIAKGAEVGTLSVISGNKVIKEIPLLAAEDITPNTLGGIIGDIMEAW